MIYKIKPGDQLPSTHGFTKQFTIWDRPTTGPSPVSFQMLDEVSPYWQSRALYQRADVDWMYVAQFDTTLTPKGLQRTIRNTTWVQGDPKTRCPSKKITQQINLPGSIEWNLYRQKDTIVIIRVGQPLVQPPGGKPGIELWTRKGVKINTAKTWAQNGIDPYKDGELFPTPPTVPLPPVTYEIYPTFSPISCWTGLGASQIYKQAFRRTTYIAPIPEYIHRIELCSSCFSKNCNYPNPDRRLWGEQCCSKYCAQ